MRATLVIHGLAAVSAVNCGGQMLLKTVSGSDSTCGNFMTSDNAHYWPIGLATTACHGWQATDPFGKVHDNSANNIQCSSNGKTMTYDQYAGSLDCSGTATSKSFVYNECHQGIPPSLYDMGTDFSCCSDPTGSGCVAITGTPRVDSTATTAETVYLDGALCDSGGTANPSPPPATSESSSPCFDREITTACKLSDPTTSPSAAFDACFTEGNNASTQSTARIYLRDLRSGDLILSTPTETTRVIVNQHVQSASTSPMLLLVHSTGSLSLTPDHVLLLDGVFKPAREATAGALLSSGASIKQVFLSSAGGIINPQTTSGRILVAAAHGEPVVSSVYGEWIASFMIDKPTFSLSRAITYLFPAQTQDFYIAALDPIFDASASGLKRAAKMPTPLLWLTMFGFDILLAASFICYSLANTQLLVALAAVAVAVAMASQARK